MAVQTRFAADVRPGSLNAGNHVCLLPGWIIEFEFGVPDFLAVFGGEIENRCALRDAIVHQGYLTTVRCYAT
jgi:hypothetical protein